MTTPKRIKSIVRNMIGEAVLAFSFAGAALLGLASVLIRGILGILAVESGRAKRRLGKTKRLV